MEYHKINGLYKRWRKDLHTEDMLPEGVSWNDFKIGEFSCPEFKYLFTNDWVWSEKLDGTNIRLYLSMTDNALVVNVRGRTEKANIPKPLMDWISTWVETNSSKILNTFSFTDNSIIILYGEGVGEKIQSGQAFGKQHFKLFDVYIDNYWLEKSAVAEIGTALNLDTAPYWIGTIQDAIDKVKSLPKSAFGDFIVEGYVGQPAVRLFNAKCERIVTKVKVRDFVKGTIHGT